MAPVRAMIFVLAVLSAVSAAVGGEGDDVYSTLRAFDLPPGVLPLGATGYTITADGQFSVTLPSTCHVKAGSHTVRYDTEISGVIVDSSLKSLDGVRVKLSFCGFPLLQSRRRETGSSLWLDQTRRSSQRPPSRPHLHALEALQPQTESDSA